MKRCNATTTIRGAKIRCKLPLDHDTTESGLQSPLTDHEYWETRKVRDGFKNVMVRWKAVHAWKYGQLQGEVRGGLYEGIK